MHIVERYSSAIHSSDLGASDYHLTDVDYLTAAGMCPDRLGSALIRLKDEYGMVSRSEAIMALNDPLTRLAVMSKLKTLSEAVQRVGQYSCWVATKTKFMKSDNEVCKLVPAIMLMLLDPSCDTCTGRGSVGEYGKIQHTCKACDGSKKRKWPKAHYEDLSFQRDILESLNAIIGKCSGRMRHIARD